MTFRVIDVPQRSPEWFAARAGRLTASSAKDVLATIKSGEAAARRDLRTRLVVERLTGQPEEDTYVNADMQRGMDLEAEAIAAYESASGNLVQRVGFLQHTDHLAGCSPDGVIDNFRGGVEVKVPRSATHLRYLRAGGLPAEHAAQVLHSLWLTNASYWDFASYDPRFPANLRLFTVRVWRIDQAMADYERAVLKFLAEVDREVEAVQTMQDAGGRFAAAAREVA